MPIDEIEVIKQKLVDQIKPIGGYLFGSFANGAATLQKQPAYRGEANAVCVNKRPQGRNGYGGW